MAKSDKQKKFEKGLELNKKKVIEGRPQKLTPTQEQMLTSKYKYERKIKLEELRHKNVIEEIKEMKKAKVTFFAR